MATKRDPAQPLRSAFSTIRELGEQLGSFPDEDLGRLMQRMNYVQTLCASDSLPDLEELAYILFNPKTYWLPKPTMPSKIRYSMFESDLSTTDSYFWRWYDEYKTSREMSKVPYQLMMVLGGLGYYYFHFLHSHGFDLCTLPDINLLDKEQQQIWGGRDLAHYQNLINSSDLIDHGCKIEAGVYLVDTRIRPETNLERWQDDRLMEEVIGRLQDEEEIAFNEKFGRGHRMMSKTDAIKVRDSFGNILQALCKDVVVEWVRLETFPLWLVLSRFRRREWITYPTAVAYSGKVHWPREEDTEGSTPKAEAWLDENLVTGEPLILADSEEGFRFPSSLDSKDLACVRLCAKLRWPSPHQSSGK
jgi:hypothetical protein